VAPRPGLEPGTYGLTAQGTPVLMVRKLQIRNEFSPTDAHVFAIPNRQPNWGCYGGGDGRKSWTGSTRCGNGRSNWRKPNVPTERDRTGLASDDSAGWLPKLHIDF